MRASGSRSTIATLSLFVAEVSRVGCRDGNGSSAPPFRPCQCSRRRKRGRRKASGHLWVCISPTASRLMAGDGDGDGRGLGVLVLHCDMCRVGTQQLGEPDRLLPVATTLRIFAASHRLKEGCIRGTLL